MRVVRKLVLQGRKENLASISQRREEF